jgi:hypothetical protein
MRMRIIIIAGLILSASTVLAAHQDESLSFSRQTFESVVLKSAPKSPVKIYEDKDFAFHYRRAGASDAPGLFVHARKLGRWIEIKKISTENAKLGRLSTGEDVGPAAGKKPYVDMPLKTDKSTGFPSKVKYDAETELYALEFDPWQKKNEHVTRFFIDREDLENAFAKAR